MGRLSYSESEKGEIIRKYLGPGGPGDWPVCCLCGEELSFRFDYGSETRRILVDCTGCANGFSWSSAAPERGWSELQVRYFLERHFAELEIRCPVCDCLVSWAEFPGHQLEFRCIFCNRRQRAAALPPGAGEGDSPRSST